MSVHDVTLSGPNGRFLYGPRKVALTGRLGRTYNVIDAVPTDKKTFWGVYKIDASSRLDWIGDAYDEESANAFAYALAGCSPDKQCEE